MNSPLIITFERLPMATKKSVTKQPQKIEAVPSKTSKSELETKKKQEPKTSAEPSSKKLPGAFMKDMVPSKELAAVIGATPLPRTQVIKGLWEYIKKNNLQDPKNKRMINADAKLQAVFGKPVVGMLELTGLANKHVTAAK